jgi:hypothetical protein
MRENFQRSFMSSLKRIAGVVLGIFGGGELIPAQKARLDQIDKDYELLFGKSTGPIKPIQQK